MGASHGTEAAGAPGACARGWVTWTYAASSPRSLACLGAARHSPCRAAPSSPGGAWASGLSPGCCGVSTPSPETGTPTSASSSSCPRDARGRSCRGCRSGSGTSAGLGPRSPSSSPCSCPWPFSAWCARGCWSGRWKTSDPGPWAGASWPGPHLPVATQTASSCPPSATSGTLSGPSGAPWWRPSASGLSSHRGSWTWSGNGWGTAAPRPCGWLRAGRPDWVGRPAPPQSHKSPSAPLSQRRSYGVVGPRPPRALAGTASVLVPRAPPRPGARAGRRAPGGARAPSPCRSAPCRR